jgi:hypothetical protein
MIAALLNAIKAAVGWFFSLVQSFGQWAINYILDSIPGEAMAQGSSAGNTVRIYINAANSWVPIDFALTLFSTFMAFVITYLTVKIVIKLIP